MPSAVHLQTIQHIPLLLRPTCAPECLRRKTQQPLVPLLLIAGSWAVLADEEGAEIAVQHRAAGVLEDELQDGERPFSWHGHFDGRNLRREPWFERHFAHRFGVSLSPA